MHKVPPPGWLAVGLVLLLGGGAFLSGQRPDTGPSSSDGPVAFAEAETIQVNDPAHGRPFDVSVWTPDAELARNELIVMSHGFSGDRTSHADLAQILILDGYTVAAPTHPDLAGLESGDPALDPLALRPRHLSLTIDAMENAAGEPFGSVAAIGHSLGGYSVLRLAGAQPELGEALGTHCDAVDDHVLCIAQAAVRFEALVNSGDEFTDERVDRVILLAPGYGPLFGGGAISDDVDVFVVSATNDAELPGSQVQDLIDWLGAGTGNVILDGGHFVFLRPCTDTEAIDAPAICEDADGVDRVAVHAELGEQISLFLQS